MTNFLGRAALLTGGLAIALLLAEGVLYLIGENLLGKRTRPGKPLATSKDSYRVLCIGESTTAGLKLESKDRYPRQLEGILNAESAVPGFVVINAGIPAIDTTDILDQLESNLDEYQPHIVVSMMGINDGPLSSPEFLVGGGPRVWKLARLVWMLAANRIFGGSESEPFTMAGLRRAKEAKQRADLERLGQLATRVDSEALAERARIELDRGENKDALSLARLALNSDPQNLEALLILGRANHAAGRTRRATEAFQRVLALDPSNQEAQYGMFETLSAKSPAAALVWGRRLLKHAPNDRELTRLVLLHSATLASQPLPNGAVPDVSPPDGEPTSAQWALEGLFAYRIGAKEASLLAFRRAWADAPDPALSAAFRWFLLNLTVRGRDDEAADVIAVAAADLGKNEPLLALCATLLEEQSPDVAANCSATARKIRLESYNPTTRENYARMSSLLAERGIQLVAVQYPMRSLATLQATLEGNQNVLYVDNEESFREAVDRTSVDEIFTDLFAGDFGHLTAEGNRLLATNVSRVILSKFPID
jgi:lysophospholipase L1-like esterase